MIITLLVDTIQLHAVVNYKFFLSMIVLFLKCLRKRAVTRTERAASKRQQMEVVSNTEDKVSSSERTIPASTHMKL